MSDWRKDKNGKWVSTKAPPVPPRPRAPGTPPPRPRRARGALGDLEAQFVHNPVTFMRLHPMLPPDNAGAGDLGAIAQHIPMTKGEIAGGALSSANPELLARHGGGIRYIRFGPGTDSNAPGAKTFVFDRDGSKGGIPIHWLPWESLSLVRYAIPPVPANLEDPDEEDHPRYFFTAGINGCSVFVQGDSTSPILTHAGITGNLSSYAREFWESQLQASIFGGPTRPIKNSISTEDYMKNRTKQIDKQMDHYVDWLKNSTGGKYDLTFLAPIGCVFGVRYGRHWTFYLQKNMVATKLTVLKPDQVDWAINDVSKHAFMKGQRNQPVTVGVDVQKVRRHLGPVPLPFTKKVRTETYTTREKVTWTMELGEFFPRRLVDTNLRAGYGDLLLDQRPLRL